MKLVGLLVAAWAFTASAQTISFDNSCGTLNWHGSCSNFVPPVSCFCFNNWDSGTFVSETCHSCPREPGVGDDVFIAVASVTLNYADPVRSLITTSAFTVQHNADVSDFAYYGGPVLARGTFRHGTHTYAGTVTVPTGASASFDVGYHEMESAMTVDPDSTVIVTGDLRNEAALLWRGDQTFYIDTANSENFPGGYLRNRAGATFLAQGNGEIRGIIAAGHFFNAGLFHKNGGFGATRIGVDFVNNGVVRVQTGTLELIGPSLLNGTVAVDAGCVFAIVSTAQLGNVAVGGDGEMQVPGAIDVLPNATATVRRLSGPGVRTGAGTLVVTDSYSLPPTFNGAGLTRIASGCAARIESDVVAHQGMLSNSGALSWLAGNIGVSAAASITNEADGVIACLGTGSLGGADFSQGQFTNLGRFGKYDGGITQIDLPFVNQGVVEASAGDLYVTNFVQQSGRTILNGGMIGGRYSDYPMMLTGGRLEGSGQVRGSLNNQGGTVAPGQSPGMITVTNVVGSAGYTQGENAALEIEIGGELPGAQYDRLTVEGAATLGGTLRVRLIDGYAPEGIQFEVLHAESIIGEFSTLDIPGNASVVYGPGSVLVEFAPPFCPADFNQDGGIDGGDVSDFFAAWENGDASADVNLDGGVDGVDVSTFFAAWENGGC